MKNLVLCELFFLFLGGTADQVYPKMNVGDIVIEINGHSCHLMKHKKAIDLIRTGGKTLRLKLLRGNGTVPEVTAYDRSNLSNSTSGSIQDR